MNSVALPAEFIGRLRQLVPGEHWNSVLASFDTRKPTVLRINTIITPADEFIEKLQQEGFEVQQLDWKPDVILVPREQRRRILNSPWYKKGQLYIQNLSSQLAAWVLNPQPGEEILDLCAAPGSKTLQMACMMADTGRIAAVEKSKARFLKMKANLKHQQVSCVDIYHTNGTGVWRKTPEQFDRVLLDAPCTSETRFRIHKPKTYQHWKLKKIKKMAKKQKALIQSAVKCLKPGGVLVYSTSAFSPEENEAVVDFALKRFEGALQVEPIMLPIDNTQPGLSGWESESFDPQVQNSLRVIPNSVMDGFYLCLMKKLASTH